VAFRLYRSGLYALYRFVQNAPLRHATPGRERAQALDRLNRHVHRQKFPLPRPLELPSAPARPWPDSLTPGDRLHNGAELLVVN
jgi:hypothetical protein